MEYKPRYPQPFALEHAVQLDVSVITEEIARLQNSLEHLRRTQQELREAVRESPDAVLIDAIAENEDVIGSQEERISILRMALTEKGIVVGSHYDPQTTTPSQPTPEQRQREHGTGIGTVNTELHADVTSLPDHAMSDDADGVYL